MTLEPTLAMVPPTFSDDGGTGMADGERGTCASDDAEQGTPSLLPSSSPMSQPSAPKRKHSAAAQSSTTSRKKQRTTEETSWADLQETFRKFHDTMSHMIVHMNTNLTHSGIPPVRQAKAIELIQVQEDDLTDDQMIAFLDLFRSDPLAAEIYLSIKTERLRKAWVRRNLCKELGFPP